MLAPLPRLIPTLLLHQLQPDQSWFFPPGASSLVLQPSPIVCPISFQPAHVHAILLAGPLVPASCPGTDRAGRVCAQCQAQVGSQSEVLLEHGPRLEIHLEHGVPFLSK